jgi:hypothetical protein
MLIERGTFQVFLKKIRAQNCRSLPLGSSSITAAVALVNRVVLTRVWDEMDYCIYEKNDGETIYISGQQNLVSIA